MASEKKKFSTPVETHFTANHSQLTHVELVDAFIY